MPAQSEGASSANTAAWLQDSKLEILVPNVSVLAIENCLKNGESGSLIKEGQRELLLFGKDYAIYNWQHLTHRQMSR